MHVVLEIGSKEWRGGHGRPPLLTSRRSLRRRIQADTRNPRPETRPDHVIPQPDQYFASDSASRGNGNASENGGSFPCPTRGERVLFAFDCSRINPGLTQDLRIRLKLLP